MVLGLVHIRCTHLAAIKGDTDSTDEEREEEDVKLLSISGKPSFPRSDIKLTEKVKLAAAEDDYDVDFSNRKAKEKKSSSKKSI